MTDKLKKLEDLINLANDGLTKQEFVANFKIIINFVQKLKDSHQQKLDQLDREYTQIIADLKKDNADDVAEIKKQVETQLTQLLNKYEAKDKAIDEKIDAVQDGKDGQDADEQKIGDKVLADLKQQIKIPTIDEIENDLPKLGTQIRDGLELLKGDERLDISAIKNLQETLDEVGRKAVTKDGMVNTLGTSAGGKIVHYYDLSPFLDGTTAVFSLPAMWRIISITSSSFPGTLRPNVDYIHDAGNYSLTFTSEIDPSTTLAAGQTLIISYGA